MSFWLLFFLTYPREADKLFIQETTLPWEKATHITTLKKDVPAAMGQEGYK